MARQACRLIPARSAATTLPSTSSWWCWSSRASTAPITGALWPNWPTTRTCGECWDSPSSWTIRPSTTPSSGCWPRDFPQLLAACIREAQAQGILPNKPRASVYATGLETSHASRYFVQRRGEKAHHRLRYPKLTFLVEHQSHLSLEMHTWPAPILGTTVYERVITGLSCSVPCAAVAQASAASWSGGRGTHIAANAAGVW